MKIEIHIEKSSRELNELVRFMEPNLESLFEKRVISFIVNEQGEWLTEKRKIDFEKRLNEQDAEHLYKITSIGVSI